ncbi:hypothetical protein RRG08_002444 [Elysia crispata]|uniref:Uncharacterized protein n=1 Tax=Elysia crispata TaxID=231223 RepID=A0AAE1A7M2_9GAST|nr:hypothetical protein RRG08_002444 [Elysia crispata]
MGIGGGGGGVALWLEGGIQFPGGEERRAPPTWCHECNSPGALIHPPFSATDSLIQQAAVASARRPHRWNRFLFLLSVSTDSSESILERFIKFTGKVRYVNQRRGVKLNLRPIYSNRGDKISLQVNSSKFMSNDIMKRRRYEKNWGGGLGRPTYMLGSGRDWVVQRHCSQSPRAGSS